MIHQIKIKNSFSYTDKFPLSILDVVIFTSNKEVSEIMSFSIIKIHFTI